LTLRSLFTALGAKLLPANNEKREVSDGRHQLDKLGLICL
jgi:hypothetical protein